MLTVDELMTRKHAEVELDPASVGKGGYSREKAPFYTGGRVFFSRRTSSAVVEKVLPIGELRKYLVYDPDAGTIMRIRKVCPGTPVLETPTSAVAVSGNKRASVSIGTVMMSAQHCAWYLMHGKWRADVYVIDGDSTNLVASNLATGKAPKRQGRTGGTAVWRKQKCVS